MGSATWLDRLPIEIIFETFDYLSYNDILYTFFFIDERLNHLLLHNQCYSRYLELPTSNFHMWENILHMIGPQIECLHIKTNDLTFPLKYFSNLKSLIISSLYDLSDEEWKLILQSKQFNHLSSFQIKQKAIFCNEYYNSNSTNQDEIFKKIFNKKNLLEIFEYSLTIPSLSLIDTIDFEINANIHSLTLDLTDFQDIFVLIELTPNLKYLNVQSKCLYDREKPLNQIDIKLKEFHFKVKRDSRFSLIFVDQSIILNEMIGCIKQFSSSLTCLSLNLINISVKNENEFPFNHLKLQQFLESMTQLKEFHLYSVLWGTSFDTDKLLSSFKGQFWLDHHWSFGIYQSYFFTLPFYFDYSNTSSKGFNSVKSSNPEILINNPRIWYNIKSIALPNLFGASVYDQNFFKEINTKIPKLNSIIFYDPYGCSAQVEDTYISNEKKENIDLRFEHVTTIEFCSAYLDHMKEWLFQSLPNFRYLILSSAKLPPVDHQLSRLLNEKIERLDIEIFQDSVLQQLAEINYVYFSNVQYIHICLSQILDKFQFYANIIIKILTNFKHLKVLLIYIYQPNEKKISFTGTRVINELNDCLDIDEITKNYQVKYFQKYSLFIKTKF